jgi:hypothetical protein
MIYRQIDIFSSNRDTQVAALEVMAEKTATQSSGQPCGRGVAWEDPCLSAFNAAGRSDRWAQLFLDFRWERGDVELMSDGFLQP